MASEIVNLEAILSMPKGTEHFLSDLHGADAAFLHVIKNASGVIRRKVDDIYGDSLSEEEKIDPKNYPKLDKWSKGYDKMRHSAEKAADKAEREAEKAYNH